ncbi:MAG: hypothetical protein Q8K12_15345 [Thiobacillus sp.]|nr:hypothetical protein [Thiobacillus sp.]
MQITLDKFSNRLRGTDFGRLGLWMLFGILAMVLSLFFGLLAVTASPILVGMAAGLVVGAFLLMKPDVLIWLILLLGLAMGAFVSMLGPQFSKITWAVSILGFVLLALSLFNLALPGRSRGQPAFIWFGLAFLIAGLSTTLFQWYSTGEVIAGVKRLLQAYGLMFAFAALALSAREIGRFKKLLLVIALIQLPFALYEFIFLVALRGGLDTGSASTDVVAGTFGANLEGGSPNSVMAIFLLITLGFLFARWKEKLLSTRSMVLLALPMLAVFFLGEVKSLFIMIPVAFLVLLKRDIPRRPGFFMLMSLFGVLFIVLLGYLYSVFIIQQSVEEIISDTLSYNVQERGYGNYYLNRLSVLEFWWTQQGWHDPVAFVFGHGLGSAFSAPSLVPGHIAMNWPNYGIDLTTASSLLWDTGVMGLSLYMLTLLAAWRACNVLQRDSNDGGVVADATAIQAAIALFVAFVFYNNTLVNHPSMEIILTCVLGYLAYLYRQHRLETA